MVSEHGIWAAPPHIHFRAKLSSGASLTLYNCMRVKRHSVVVILRLAGLLPSSSSNQEFSISYSDSNTRQLNKCLEI